MILLTVLLTTLHLQGVLSAGFYLLDSNQQVTTSGYGLLMFNGGTVCDDDFVRDGPFRDKTADWICRMMGYESLKEWTSGRKYSWQDGYTIILDDVRCTGSVVPQCQYTTTEDCGHSEDVWLNCNVRTQRGNPNSFYLLDNSARYTQSGHGLLMYQGGTVCDDGFNDRTADWVCRLMGYEDAADWVNDRQFSFQEDLPIKIDNLVCSDGSYTDILPSCSSGISSADDTHEEDIWIWCNSVVIAECPAGYKVRLENKLCEECPPSTYSPTPNIDYTCQPCPQGSNSSAGAAHCTCEGGSYLSSDLSSCLTCPQRTISKEGSMSSTKCVPCPEGTHSINGGKACSCKRGYGWMWISDEEGQCSPCSVNFFKDPATGTCRQCPVEATSLPLSEGCICATGLSWDGESCVDCVTANLGDRVCGCKAGTFWNTFSSTCEECPENHFSEDYSESCSKCPVYTVSKSNSAECYSCPSGLSWKNFACVECPDDHIGNGANCVKCPEGTTPSQDKTMCQKTNSLDILSVAGLVLSGLVLVLILALAIWTKIRVKNEEDLKLCYRAGLSTLEMSGRRCMCPDCPCSDGTLNRPALPPREAAVQDDVYANFG